MSANSKETHLCVLCNNKLESKEALKDHFRKHANKEIDGKGRPLGPNGESVVDVTKFRGLGYEKGSASKFVDGVITCDVCGEKFKCNTMAIQHKFRKHPKSSLKYYCPQCGMQFPLKIHRDKHLANHSPTNTQSSAVCYACGETFYNSTALDYHFKSTHQRIISLYQPVVTPPPSKKIKVNNAGDPQSVYYCHLCGFEYIVKFNLQKHLERQHTMEERNNTPLDFVKCITCDALFCSQKAYQNHNMYHKPDDLYVTSEQERLRTVTRVDQDFDIRRVQLGAEKYIPTYRRRRRTNVTPLPKPKKKPAEDSSDEMSPPSPMDTSSESESEQPLTKRIKSQEETKANNSKETRAKNSEETKAKNTEETKAKNSEETKAENSEKTKAKNSEETKAKNIEETKTKKSEETKTAKKKKESKKKKSTKVKREVDDNEYYSS